MDTPAFLYAARWLIRDTFSQALTSRLFGVLLGASALAILFCLSVSIDGPRTLRPPGETELVGPDNKPFTGSEGPTGSMSLLFGLVRVDLFRDAETEVHFLQAFFASWVAGVAGVLLALLWLAGFVPESLRPEVAAVQMARPLPLWLMLLGKYLGVVAFVAVQATVFFVGTWVALGLRTGIWFPSYLLGIPLLVLHFSAFYCVSIYLAVLMRSTVVAAVGTTLFWFICLGVNYGRYAVVALPVLAPTAPPFSPLSIWLIEAAYWVLPKPADYLIALEELLGLADHQATLSSLPEFRVALEQGAFDPWLSIWATLGFMVVVLALAGRQMVKSEY